MFDVEKELEQLRHLQRVCKAQQSGDFDALMGALKVIVALNQNGDDKPSKDKSYKAMQKLFDPAFADVFYASVDGQEFVARGATTAPFAMELEKFKDNIGAMHLFAALAAINAISARLVNVLKANLSFAAIAAVAEEIEKITPEMFDPAIVAGVLVDVDTQTHAIKLYEVK